MRRFRIQDVGCRITEEVRNSQLFVLPCEHEDGSKHLLDDNRQPTDRMNRMGQSKDEAALSEKVRRTR